MAERAALSQYCVVIDNCASGSEIEDTVRGLYFCTAGGVWLCY